LQSDLKNYEKIYMNNITKQVSQAISTERQQKEQARGSQGSQGGLLSRFIGSN
jgi:hypothetical protein